jgi:hypothetical protein
LQRDRLLGHLEHGADAFDGKVDFLGDFLRRRFAAVFLDELLLHAHQLVDRLDHVDRDADGAGLVGDRAGDGLADPPGGVGGELVAAAVFEFLDRLHQAHVAFLDEVEEGEAAVGVFLGDGNDEAEVGLDHLGFRLERFLEPVAEQRLASSKDSWVCQERCWSSRILVTELLVFRIGCSLRPYFQNFCM